jgi:hypothetical protein
MVGTWRKVEHCRKNVGFRAIRVTASAAIKGKR